jgi:hypothetical protein
VFDSTTRRKAVTNVDDELPPSDKNLMNALAAAIGSPSPTSELLAHCEGLLAWIDVDAELASLLDQPVAEAAGTRGAATTTGLEFAVGDGSCMIEVTPLEGSLRGQLLGDVATDAVLRTVTGTTQSAPIDDLGEFEFDEPPSGTVRLEVHLASGRRIHTDWFVV